MTRSVLVVMLVVTTAQVRAADDADPKTQAVPAKKLKAAAEMVAKLDDTDITVRDRTAAKLKDLGREALPAMEAALKAKPSNRMLDHLLILLPDARRHELNVRARCFLADMERKYEHNLPGWNELKAVVKDTKESRLLMADILNDDDCRDMLVLARDNVTLKQYDFNSRWDTKYNEWKDEHTANARAGRPSRGTCPPADGPIHWLACALLADSMCGRDYQSHYRHYVVPNYAATDEGKRAVAGKGRYGPVVRDLLLNWVSRQDAPNGLRDAHMIAVALWLEKAVVRGILEKQFELYFTTGKAGGAGMAELAATQDPKYVASFRRLFGSSEPYQKANPDLKMVEIQLRDSALAMCISLSSQKPADYGFDMNFPKGSWFSPSNYYFADSGGKTADDKWAAWEKANPDKIKANPPEQKDDPEANPPEKK